MSTVPDVADLPAERRAHRWRRLGLGMFTLLVLAGLFGFLGVRTRTISDGSGDGLRVELTYAAVTRPGLAVPYRLVISRTGGFDQPIDVRISLPFVEAFDENGLNPEPAETTTEGDELVWTFDPPPRSSLTISFDVRIEPGVQWRRSGTTTVSNAGDRVALDHTMWVLP